MTPKTLLITAIAAFITSLGIIYQFYRFEPTGPARPIAEFETISYVNGTLSFSPDGSRLVHALKSEDGESLEIRDTETGARISRSTVPASGSAIPAWRNDPPGLFTKGYANNKLVFWNGVRWTENNIEGLDWGLVSNALAELSPDGSALAISNFNSDVSVIYPRTREMAPFDHGITQPGINGARPHAYIARWSPNGKWLATGHSGVVLIFDAHTLQEVRRYDGISSSVYEEARIFELEWSPSGRFLSIQSLYGTALLAEPGSDTLPLSLSATGAPVFESYWRPQQADGWFNPLPDTLIFTQTTRASGEGNKDQKHLIWFNAGVREVIAQQDFSDEVFASGPNLLGHDTEADRTIVHVVEVNMLTETASDVLLFTDRDGHRTRRPRDTQFGVVTVSPDGQFLITRETRDDGSYLTLWNTEDFLRGQ